MPLLAFSAYNEEGEKTIAMKSRNTVSIYLPNCGKKPIV